MKKFVSILVSLCSVFVKKLAEIGSKVDNKSSAFLQMAMAPKFAPVAVGFGDGGHCFGGLALGVLIQPTNAITQTRKRKRVKVFHA